MYGNINPHETFLDNNRPFKHLLSLMGKNRDKLTDTFTDQQREMHSLSEQAAFQYGFSLGVRLMMESVSS